MIEIPTAANHMRQCRMPAGRKASLAIIDAPDAGCGDPWQIIGDLLALGVDRCARGYRVSGTPDDQLSTREGFARSGIQCKTLHWAQSSLTMSVYCYLSSGKGERQLNATYQWSCALNESGEDGGIQPRCTWQISVPAIAVIKRA